MGIDFSFPFFLSPFFVFLRVLSWIEKGKMMRMRNMLAVAVLLTVSSAALADTPAQARKAIEADYVKIAAALSHKDLDAAFAYETPDYVAVSKNGTQLKRDDSHKMMRQISFADKVKVRATIVTFALKGNIATVRHRGHIEASIMNPQTNQATKVSLDALTEDTWTKGSGKWLLKRSQELSSNRKMGAGK